MKWIVPLKYARSVPYGEKINNSEHWPTQADYTEAWRNWHRVERRKP